MSIYVLAEHDNKKVKPSTFSAINAALKVSSEVIILVAGFSCAAVARSLSRCEGVCKVLLADHPCFAHPLAERLTELMLAVLKDASHIVAPATTFGKNVMPRVAACFDVAQISDVIAFENLNTYCRPIYAGNVIEKVQSQDRLQVVTVRCAAFSSDVKLRNMSAPIAHVDYVSENKQSTFIAVKAAASELPDLATAKVVLAGGRGLKDCDGFTQISEIAGRLGAAVGASRAAVDAGLAPNDWQVGQTGQVVAPQLYFALGISGAVQHLAGMKDSKLIVAINKDPDAPIFAVADYGLVADLHTVLPEWVKLLDEMGY